MIWLALWVLWSGSFFCYERAFKNHMMQKNYIDMIIITLSVLAVLIPRVYLLR